MKFSVLSFTSPKHNVKAYADADAKANVTCEQALTKIDLGSGSEG